MRSNITTKSPRAKGVVLLVFTTCMCNSLFGLYHAIDIPRIIVLDYVHRIYYLREVGIHEEKTKQAGWKYCGQKLQYVYSETAYCTGVYDMGRTTEMLIIRNLIVAITLTETILNTRRRSRYVRGSHLTDTFWSCYFITFIITFSSQDSFSIMLWFSHNNSITFSKQHLQMEVL